MFQNNHCFPKRKIHLEANGIFGGGFEWNQTEKDKPLLKNRKNLKIIKEVQSI